MKRQVKADKRATKGVLTRLALMFQGEPDRIYTGAEIVTILLRVITVIEHGCDPLAEAVKHDLQANQLENGS